MPSIEHREKREPIDSISHSPNSEFTGQTLTEKRSGKTQGLFERTQKTHLFFIRLFGEGTGSLLFLT